MTVGPDQHRVAVAAECDHIAQPCPRDLFARALARRAGLPAPDLAATAQASAALGAIAPAVMAWAEGDEDLIALVDAAFAALAAGVSPSVNSRA